MVGVSRKFMIKKSFCKINLALAVTERRADGFHAIESVIYPVRGIWDTVEMERATQFSFSTSGIALDCADEKNLCVRAYRLMAERFALPAVALSLHKNIPFGAGLGAGSANAVAVLELCDEMFALGLNNAELKNLAAELGSDTAFFVDCAPAVARARGELLEPAAVDLSGYYIYMVKPDVGVSTREAYSMIAPAPPLVAPSEAVKYPIEEWPSVCVNDFERSVFEQLPILAELKKEMYAAGAIYASMSGSGSTVYGIFEQRPTLEFPYFSHMEML